jgi:hypothetical protein
MNIIIPKFGKSETIPAWVERSLRHGNFLHELMRREKGSTDQRLQRAVQKYRNYERRKGSDFELISVMDGRTFMRWQQTDEGIIQDPKEFKKLVKDNPVMTPWKR